MSQPRRSARADLRGFTLIELLVVVAIIAMLISILLPSLSKARAQARTTLCLSRIGQLGKAFMIYADDYGEAFPFIATCHEPVDQPEARETWLADWLSAADPVATLERVIHSDEEAWYTGPDPAPRIIRSGILFSYTRFETLYRCPEFERNRDSSMAHKLWNYTRGFWGRYWKVPQEVIEETGSPGASWGSTEGPIVKSSQVHNPANLPMLIGEQWNRFVATSAREGDNGSAWNGNDFLWAPDNNGAVAHGQPVTARFHKWDRYPGREPFLWKRAGVFFYDSHAELMRDPWPALELGPDHKRTGPFRGDALGPDVGAEMPALNEYVNWLLYAQRGLDLNNTDGAPPRIY